MYCVSIGTKDYKKAIKVISGYEMAEIRLDLCEFDRRQVKEIFSLHNNLIATFRKVKKDNAYRDSILKTSIAYGAQWLDLDMLDNDEDYIRELKEFCLGFNTKLILSVHNYTETPPLIKINKYIDKATNLKADLIKLVFYANNDEDNERTLSIYNKNTNLVAFNMGEKGQITRPKSLELGAPFTYVSIKGEITAPGQMTMDEIKKYPQLHKRDN